MQNAVKHISLIPRLIREKLKEVRIVYFLYGLLRRIKFEFVMACSQLIYFCKKWVNPGPLLLPPPRLRYWVHGNKDESSFLAGGQNAFRDMKSILQEYKKWDLENLNVLDFGCGCARVLRHFFEEKPELNYWGTDVDAKCIAWNQKYLPDFSKWDINTAAPPIHYEDNYFDIIMANSLFTHLDENYQFIWLNELSRVLKEDGIAIFSVNGESVWNSLDAEHPIRLKLAEQGFYFHVNNIGIRNFAGFPDFYQTTFHTRHYIVSNWTRYFSILDYVEKGEEEYQSFVVLSKTAPVLK